MEQLFFLNVPFPVRLILYSCIISPHTKSPSAFSHSPAKLQCGKYLGGITLLVLFPSAHSKSKGQQTAAVPVLLQPVSEEEWVFIFEMALTIRNLN
jgi:hypothetical protein